MIRLNLNSPL
ncbi:hypothetical protein AYI70_g11831, partial [Smittium culicis]